MGQGGGDLIYHSKAQAGKKKEIYTDSNLESKTVHRKQQKKAKKTHTKKQYKYVNFIKVDKMIALIFTKT